jgi:hypothetical protein
MPGWSIVSGANGYRPLQLAGRLPRRLRPAARQVPDPRPTPTTRTPLAGRRAGAPPANAATAAGAPARGDSAGSGGFHVPHRALRTPARGVTAPALRTPARGVTAPRAPHPCARCNRTGAPHPCARRNRSTSYPRDECYVRPAGPRRPESAVSGCVGASIGLSRARLSLAALGIEVSRCASALDRASPVPAST